MTVAVISCVSISIYLFLCMYRNKTLAKKEKKNQKFPKGSYSKKKKKKTIKIA